MKRSLSLLAAGLVAVNAQAPNSLPQCGQTCVNNMLAIAVSDFGCDANDLASCACCNQDFGFGIRDCSRQVCGDGSEDFSSVISYGSSYCSSAVTTCPSGTQATSVLATATGSGNATGTDASGSMTTPAMTSGPLAGAVASLSSVSGAQNAYVVGGETISAGGDGLDNDGTSYTVLPGGAGVIVSNGESQTTYLPDAIGGSGNSSGMQTMTSGGGALGAAAGQVSSVSGSPNQYVVGDQTISAGGDGVDQDGTTYTALPSGGGVLINADGSSTTVNPASGAASTTSGGGAGGSSSTTGGSGGGAGGSNQSGGGSGGESTGSSDTGNIAPIKTAAPALIGAAAMAILAL